MALSTDCQPIAVPADPLSGAPHCHPNPSPATSAGSLPISGYSRYLPPPSGNSRTARFLVILAAFRSIPATSAGFLPIPGYSRYPPPTTPVRPS